MGKTMPKSTVIYGQQHAISVASFSGSHLNDIEALIHDKVGPEVVVPKAAINKAVAQAKNNKKMKDAYVKIGVIDGDLILRCKEKKFFGDIEIDVVLVKGYKPKVARHEKVKLEQQLEAIEKAAVEREKERVKKEKEARLHAVMNTPNEQGETMRERLLRAADKGKKLGVGQGTQEDLDRKGLTEMVQHYHGEVLDHQQNRYGRYLTPLMDVWKKAEPPMNFSAWLDEVEKGNKSVKGVDEALQLSDPEVGPIVKAMGTSGGLMIYLDENTRKPYEARVNKGAITGTHITGTEIIFVIGPDNKIYGGPKQRAQEGVRGAFNHSSFFSGAPVRSAGTLRISGGVITLVSNASGHYAPSRAMIATAMRKFGGNDEAWLKNVRVKVGSKVQSGEEFMGEDGHVRARQTWGKYSHGALHRDEAARLLQAAEDGAWLLREGSDGSFVVSFRKGDKIDSRFASMIGQLELDRKKLLPPNTPPAPSTLKPESASQLRNAPAYHGNLNRQGAEALLNGQPDGSWLIREGRGGVVAFSIVRNARMVHVLVNSDDVYKDVQAHMRTFRNLRITA